jgi:N-acetylmuramoyl-L-alanine amidase
MARYRIYLSPSNQTANEGVNGYNEAEKMRALAARIKLYLDKSPMFQAKISDIGMGLMQVSQDSDMWGSDLHICLHSDADSNPKTGGATAFIYAKGGQGEKFANVLYGKVSALSPGIDRGIIVRPGLCELNSTKAPAVLIENFFHTNPLEVANFNAHFDDYAMQTALAVYELYNVPYPEPVKVTTQTWKIDAVKWAKEKGYISELHDPLEKLDLGTLFQILKNMEA